LVLFVESFAVVLMLTVPLWIFDHRPFCLWWGFRHLGYLRGVFLILQLHSVASYAGVVGDYQRCSGLHGSSVRTFIVGVEWSGCMDMLQVYCCYC